MGQTTASNANRKGGQTSQVIGSAAVQGALLLGAQLIGLATAPGPHRVTAQEFQTNPGDATNVWPYIAGTVETTPHFIRDFGFDSKKVKNDVGVGEIIAAGGAGALASAAAAWTAAGGDLNPSSSKMIAVATAALIGGATSAIAAGLGQLRTASYRYYSAFLYGIANCGGTPIDGVEYVKVDETFVGTGSNNAGGQMLCDFPTCWGGDHALGGVYWVCRIIPGKYWPEQQPDPYLTAHFGSNAVAYSGKSLFLVLGPDTENGGARESGYFAATAGDSPVVRPVKLKVKRLPDVLNLPEFKAVNTHDANLANVAYEWLTNKSFGAKRLPASKLDIDSFRAGAETHFNEGLGVSLEWNSEIDVESAIDSLQSIGNVGIFGSLRTGQLRYKPIRRDYSIPSLLQLKRGSDGLDNTDCNVVSVEYDPSSYANTFNDYQFDFEDRDNNFLPTRRNAPDPANRMIQQRHRAVTEHLEGTKTAEQAAFIGTRELREGSFPPNSVRVEALRNIGDVEALDVVSLTDHVEGMTKILRVFEVEPFAPDADTVSLICREDTFGIGSSAYTAPTLPDLGGSLSNPELIPASLTRVVEAPYHQYPSDDAHLLVFARKPASTLVNYDLRVQESGVYVDRAAAVPFAVSGTITESVARLTDVTISTLTFTPDSSFEASRLRSASAEDVGAGSNLIFWDDGTEEYGAVEGIEENLDGTFTLSTVWRAVMPSVPVPHAAGARVWFFTYGAARPSTSYSSGNTARVKLLSRTITARLAEADAPVVTQAISAKSHKPYPVRGVTINAGYLTETVVTGDLTIAWHSTNRLLEGIHPQDFADVTEEDDTEYEVKIRGETNQLLRTVTQSGLSYVYANATELSDSGSMALEDQLNFHITVVRDGVRSNTYIRRVLRVAESALSEDVQVNGVAAEVNAVQVVKT